jgi:nucleoside-diphosphate-sugar epimerase
MAVWLVTGGGGFVGRHVLEALAAGGPQGSDSDPEIIVVGRRRPTSGAGHRFIEADLNDARALRQAIRGLAPDYVIHTAGKTPPALDDELYQANFWSTTHLLGALRSLDKPMRIVLAGSAAELGPVLEADLPVAENHAAEPVEAYGRSKLLATRSGLAERPPLEVIAARLFNVIGPGMPSTQAFGAFASRLAEPGPDPLDLPVGHLDPRRDFVDVRDAAGAMIALAVHGRAGQIYHVGTGESHAIAEGLTFLVQSSGRSVVFREDPTLLGRPGPGDSRAAIGRIVAETGWRPRIAFEESLRDLWREVSGRQPVNPWREAGAMDALARRLPLTA